MKIFILATLLVLSSCSSLSRDECNDTNWRKIGINEGSYGKPSNFDAYEKQCKKFGDVSFKSDYDQGHLEGLEIFCTYSNGYYFGSNQQSNVEECKQFNSDFSRGFKDGIGERENKSKQALLRKKAMKDLEEQEREALLKKNQEKNLEEEEE